MKNYGRFGPLLGVINITNSHCKFLVFASQNAEILTCHEIDIIQLYDVNKTGWIEYNPMDIWKAVVECIEICTKNLNILDINQNDIVGLGITNERGTTILWNKLTGAPLYNAIAWNDTRTCSTLDSLLSKIKNKKHYLKSVCGLTLSSHFSSIKLKWMLENIEGITNCCDDNNCYFGTIDTWILWNITGGINGGIHVTDVTNASHTMLMNLENLKWDKNLCDFFKIPMNILPKIKSCSEIYGFVNGGPLKGVAIAGCIGDQQAALLGQMCLEAGKSICTYDDSGSILFNTGQEIIDSENGLLSTVGYQLGPKEKVFYALEGIVACAGSCVTWLKDMLSITLTNNNNETDSTTTDLVFIPAFCGLCSPFWNHSVRGVLLGLNNHTTKADIALAAYESICYQTREIFEALKKDCRFWSPIERIFAGGELSENFTFLQKLTDICGFDVERPQLSHPSSLGAMIAAGLATNVLTLENNKIMTCYLYAPPSDIFSPIVCGNEIDFRYEKWKSSVKKLLLPENDILLENQQNNRNYYIENSIPGGIFFFSAFAILTLAQYLSNKSIL